MYISSELQGVRKAAGLSPIHPLKERGATQLRPTSISLEQGKFNRTTVMEDMQGRKYVLRRRMEHTETQGQKLEAELNRIGFLGDGGTFSFRTEAEEREFLTVLELYGCKSVTPRAEVWNGILLPFVEGINLMEQLFAGGTTGIQPALDDICRAHTHGIVYGDRWPKNIIVRPDGDITQIDFDIHVSGQYAPELELAQFLFGCIRDASRKELVFQVIRRTLSVIDFSDYNVLKIQEYLDKYVERYVCKNYDEDSHFLSVQQAGYHLEQLLSRLTYRTHR